MATATFLEASRNAGFDFAAGLHPWLMVPMGGYNHVRLAWSSGLVLRLQNEQLASVETFAVHGATRVRLQGRQPGETVLEVFDPAQGTVVAGLDLSILPKKIVPISFHFLTDAQGHTSRRIGPTNELYLTSRHGPMTVRHRPRNPLSMLQCVQQCLKDLNDIYSPQANIRFQLVNFGQAHVNRDLGDHVHATVNFRNKLRLLRDAGARINVFFVWDIVVPPRGVIGMAPWPLSDAIAAVDDESDAVGQTVAHEVGHILLRPLVHHHRFGPANRHLLMHWAGSSDARYIPRSQAVHMNRQA